MMPSTPEGGEREKDITYLILGAFHSYLEIAFFPTSKVIKADCGHWAWISPSAQAVMVGCVSMCEDCSTEIMADEAVPKFAPAGTIDAIRELEGDAVADYAAVQMAKDGVTEVGPA